VALIILKDHASTLQTIGSSYWQVFNVQILLDCVAYGNVRKVLPGVLRIVSRVVFCQEWDARAFAALDTDARGFIYKNELLELIEFCGVTSHHQLKPIVNSLHNRESKHPISLEEFAELTHSTNFIKKVLDVDNLLVIPQFKAFHKHLKNVYDEVKQDSSYQWGEVASYIPSLFKADPLVLTRIHILYI
jgi:hypothetical protein